MSSAGSNRRAARRYAFACSQCRRKKIACDGDQPSCRRCNRSGEACSYPQRTAESRLEDAQSRIAQLESELGRKNGSYSRDGQGNNSTKGPLRSNPENPPNESGAHEVVEQQDDLSPHIGLDENGHVTYHGPTSRFSFSIHGDVNMLSTPRPSGQPEDGSTHSLSPAAPFARDFEQPIWQSLLESKTESELGAPPALVHSLLNSYWTWGLPLHSCVYKPAFLMDMALGGPNYSKFLLHSLLALAARHIDVEAFPDDPTDKGERYMQSARELLVTELAAKRPKIPTIQGLLILSGRQCATGSTSEGWMYLGMAIRSMIDIGLHLDLNKLAELERLSPLDLELRKRLYCSCFIWDKSLSLSLGRPPTLRHIPSSALSFLDHSDDNEMWVPGKEFPDYPPTRTYASTCFQYFCRLGRIVEAVMRPPAPSTPTSELEERVSALETRLLDWHKSVPETLKIDPDSEICPPPHILSLNLFYSTLLILLWRPHLHTLARARQTCSENARIVHKLFVLFGRTFRWTKMTYLVSYCLYTAATVDVQEMISDRNIGSNEAGERLTLSLQLLQNEAKQTPGIRRSIDIIKNQLRTWRPMCEGQGYQSHSNEHPAAHTKAQHSSQSVNAVSALDNERAAQAYMTGNDMLAQPASQSDGYGDNLNWQGFPVQYDLDGLIFDTGGGFQDAFPFAFDDPLPLGFMSG